MGDVLDQRRWAASRYFQRGLWCAAVIEALVTVVEIIVHAPLLAECTVGAVGVLCGWLAWEWSTVTVSAVADGEGVALRVNFASSRWPRPIVLSAASISEVRAEADIRPLQWGGWGYRGSLRIGRRAALIGRRGEGIVVLRTNGKKFAVTLDQAETFARNFR